MEVPGRRFNLTGCDDERSYGVACEPCEENQRSQIAVSYCVDCNEFICDACERTHRGSKISKHHQILDQKNMPKQKMSSGGVNFCLKHGDKLLEYYCKTHGELSCSVCINIIHRHCNGVDYIKDAAIGFGESVEFKDLMSKMEQLTKTLKEHIECVEKSRAKTEHQFKVTISEIHHFKQEVNSILDTLEDKMNTAVKVIHDKNLETIGAIKESCQSIQTQVDNISADIENHLKYKQGHQLFVTTKMAERQLQEFEKDMPKLTGENKLNLKTFKPNENLVEMLNSVQLFGSLIDAADDENNPGKATEPEAALNSVKTISNADTSTPEETASAFNQATTTTRNSSNLSKKDPSKWKANFVGEIQIGLKQDRSNCYITSSINTAEGKLILVDNNNNCLKWLAVSTKDVSLLTNFTSKPWDIDLYKDKQYIVSAENKLVFVNIDKEASIDREMLVGGDCRGVACIEDRIVISFAAPNPCIKMVDSDGDILKVIKQDNRGNPMFRNPWYVRASPDHKHFLVTDFENHRVSRHNTDGGQVTSYYTDKGLKGPTGMSTASEGVIFLAGRKSHNLHMVSEGCKQIQMVLPRRAGEELPQSVLWCPDQDKLFIGHNWRTKQSNIISVYKIQ